MLDLNTRHISTTIRLFLSDVKDIGYANLTNESIHHFDTASNLCMFRFPVRLWLAASGNKSALTPCVNEEVYLIHATLDAESVIYQIVNSCVYESTAVDV